MKKKWKNYQKKNKGNEEEKKRKEIRTKEKRQGMENEDMRICERSKDGVMTLERQEKGKERKKFKNWKKGKEEN